MSVTPIRLVGMSASTPAKPWVPAPQDPPRQRASAAAPSLSHHPSRIAPREPLIVRLDRFIAASTTSKPGAAIDKLRQPLPPDRWIGWLVTLVITALSFVIRLVNLGHPDKIMFDETYYAKDAWSLLQYGYEGTWVGDATQVKEQVAQGDWSALTSTPSWAVHPPLGKWLIAVGEWFFGLNPFGWRFMALVFGTLTVFVVIRLARRLSHSTLIGGLAGLLLSVDGLSFVLSRLALLDIFQSFFIVAGVACVVADRAHFRNRLADHLLTQPGHSLAGRAGPFVFRGWLIGAGVMFGAGCAVKWTTVYPLAVFAVLALVWSLLARRLAGAGRRSWWGLVSDGLPAFVSMVVLAVGVYLASWIPWLHTAGGFERQWGASHPDDWVVRHFGAPLGSLWRNQVDTFHFHTGEQMAKATHTYGSSAWVWPLDGRTVGIFAENNIMPGEQGCAAVTGQTCMRVVTALGTPFLWWAGALALLVALVWWLAGLDWRFGAPVLGFAATWLPWFFTGRGAIFSFYAVTMVPFTVIALAMVLGVVLGPARAGPRRKRGAMIVGAIVGAIILDFAFVYPILTGELMTRRAWQLRMWLPGWV